MTYICHSLNDDISEYIHPQNTLYTLISIKILMVTFLTFTFILSTLLFILFKLYHFIFIFITLADIVSSLYIWR